LHLDQSPRVCRIGTHLFHFAEFREQVARWGRGAKRAVASWYEDMPVDKLAYQAVKYRKRDGWKHRDLLRLSHPKPDGDNQDQLFKFITGKDYES
jgi:60 kDa SS-A/Ro ribonucleoprotein